MKRVLIHLLVLLSTASFAQQAKKIMTFEEAVKIALRNSVLLNQQKNSLESMQAQKTSNLAGLGPTLGLQASANQVNGNTFNQQKGQVVNGTFDQVTTSLNAGINIFSGFSQINRIKQSYNLVEAQAFYINRAAQDVINAVTAAYLSVLLDTELLTIANENWTALQKQLEQTTEQVNLGAKSPVEQYNQDSQTKAAEIRALQAEITLINDRALLTQILLQDPSDEYDVVKPDWKILSAEEKDFAALYETALKNRGDYQRAVHSEEAAKFGMRATRGSMLPSLVAFGTIYTAYNRAQGDVDVRSFSDQFRTDNLRKIYGLQLNVPILGGNQALQNRANYIQQKVLFENSQLARQGTEVQVKTDVLRAQQNYNLFSKTFAVSQSQLKAAEIAYQFETERYKLGVSNFVDFSNANRVYVQAQTDRAQAEYRLLFQRVLLDYALGTLKPEDYK